MAEVTLKSVTIENGETIAYRERTGGEEVLLLVHGNMTSSKHWDLLIDTLDEKYKIYAIDLRGFGGSSYHQAINSIKDFSDDLKQLVDVIGLERFSLMGWSTGGAVSMQFTIDHHEQVNRLILLASASTRGYPFVQVNPAGEVVRCKSKEEIEQDTTKSLPVLKAYETRNKEFLRALWNAVIYTTKQPPEDLYDQYTEDMLTQRNLTDVYHALNTFNISDVHNGLSAGTGRVKEIGVPTLVLWGENDLVVTEQMTKEISEDLGKVAKVVYLQGCGHSPLVDNLKLLKHEVECFLEGYRLI
ncbi:alpha/beta hydrolase [Anaerobacillus sp. CMMVII]|uniref:intracellular short-chain-length polyhydroxyalkanoate depolymerase n=1 Tax=Anaerobacillus sp. CMMVII TaxID=2755588 RepID=UPI0021B7BEA2|nr:alpha/beta hydrolase [Anaerobacillus sp. CMMVII]MCT8136796.1 alpha/beta hydrolase [Anaerobacillus sp. CMMVII]